LRFPRKALLFLILGVSSGVPGLLIGEEPASSRLTGWFSDEKCATERVAEGRIGPTGRSCTLECLRKGVPMAFIDETGKTVLRVDNPRIVAGREGDHVQIEAVRRDEKTLHVTSVKVLEKYAAKCSVE
jgi:hypothetical protein